MRGKKSSNFILFLCLLVLFIAASTLAAAQTGEEIGHPVFFISVAPEIDGRLDEPVWQSLPETTGFYVLGGDVARAKQTFFRIGWDKDNLYIGIKCEEPDIMEVVGIGDNGGPLWQEDSVEIFLAPAFPNYFQFIVNTIGSRMGSVGPAGIHTIEFWEAQSYRGEGFWSTEIKIPFESLGLDRSPRDGETWRGNITRNITVFTSGGDRLTTWALLESRFHEPDNFAYFLFLQEELFVLREEVRKRFAPPVIWKEMAPPVFSRHPGGTFAKGKLTSASGPRVAPRLSPCMKKVLFNSFRGGRMGVWIVDYEGEKEERICDGEEASWSPDGKRIIFTREGRIVEKVLTSGEERIISPPGFQDSSFPGYSPDGKRIIFIEDKRGIFILEPGQEPRHLLEVFQRDVQCAPCWSPDGRRIAFQDGGAIYVIDIDGSNRRRLTTAGGIQASPFWSICGRGIAYTQASDPDGPWDLYIMGVDDGREPRRRMRKLDLNPDWRVEYFGESLPPQMGSHLHLRELGETSIAIENDWLTLSLSPEGAFVLPKHGEERIEFILFNKKGERLSGVRGLRLLKNDGEEIIIEAHYYQRSWGRLQRWLRRPVRIAYRIPRTRPIVEVLPEERSGRIHIRADMHFLLLPDRLAGDLILDPSRFSTSRVPLPSTKLSVGLLGSGNSLLLVSSKGEMELTRGKQVWTGIEASLEEGSLSVAILTGEDIWNLKKEAIEDSIIPETPGLYRLSLYDKGKLYTRIFSAGEKIPIPEGWKRPELALSYLYGRTGRTPTNLLTIIDIMKEIEERPLGKILEREGLLTYHIPQRKPDPGPAEAPSSLALAPWPVGVPKPLTIHRPVEDWARYPHISFIIESLRDIHKHPHGKEYTAYLSGVIEGFIEGMNRRLVEYTNFTRQIDSLLEVVERESPERGEFIKEMERIKKELNDLRERRLHLKPKEDITEHFERIRVGRADHASFNILFDAVAERRGLLRGYKGLAMSLRDSAGMAITREPAIRELAEETRNWTEVIGRRHFIEKKELMVIFRGWGRDQDRFSHVVTLLLE